MGTVGIVGLGAVGTSIGLALRATGEVTIGFDTSSRHLEQSMELGAIGAKAPGLHGFARCRAIFVAVPPGDVVEVSRAVLEASDAVVIDVASVKTEIANAIRSPRFVPSHPLRGTHLSGPAAGRRDLFVGATWAVCPCTWTCIDRVAIAEDLIRKMGAEPLRLDAAEHDAVMATTSHLPHVAASGLVHVLGARDQALARRMVGRGFLDTTRIARASPALWADITLHNRAEVSESITELVDRLQAVKAAITQGDAQGVMEFFSEAHRLMEDALPPDAGLPARPRIREISGALNPRNRRRRALAGELGGAH
jgi:prephenate dehydrogenase